MSDFISKLRKKRILATIILLILGIGGLAAARTINGFADFYGFNIYPFVVGIFAPLSDIFPFSLAETELILGVILLLKAIVFFISGIIIYKGRRIKFIAASFINLFLFGSVILFMFTYGCGINYSRKPFSEISGLTTSKYTKEQVCEVLTYNINRINEIADRIILDENGNAVIPTDLSEQAKTAMDKLSEKYPSISAYRPKVKPVMLSELMCYGQITGVFTFFSMEANYNTANSPENIGFVFCHELSHMSGFMREDEANFISYLACRESEDDYLKYSGYYNVVEYLLNAYYPEVSATEYARVMSMLDSRIYNQIVLENELWDKYETDFGEVAEAMNDIYLKINDQSDGTKSYGRVVDLVIADYYNNISN